VKLWEVATSRCLVAYTGAGIAGPNEPQFRVPAAFNHNEDYGYMIFWIFYWFL